MQILAMTLHYVCLLNCVGCICLAAGLGRISVSHVHWHMDRVMWVLAWWKLVEAAWHRCWEGIAFVSHGWYQHPWASGEWRQGLRYFLFFRLCGFWPCVWTHLKKGLVPYSSGWWDVWQIPTCKSFTLELIFIFIHTQEHYHETARINNIP